ncbi:uncharacterized protein LOC129587759 [Paramacrobiotus metropolitanus]|uniref:uncharacterized protein LOC129587759 n=1 Tax=Paramacrobiotus metropolitanus TaxID=2943436 RepID=UPI0024460FC9|nr:uncharacterized protein LOC129587759 [Paramacrobiotus metropolitanus]
MEAPKKLNTTTSTTTSRYGPTLMPMHYLQAPGMRGLRSPSRESIASDFSVMSMSSQYQDGGTRRKRAMQFLSKSRETLNSGFDQLSLNVSIDVPSLPHQPDAFFTPGQNATVKPHNQMTRCFSFTDLRSNSNHAEQDPAAVGDQCPAAISDPSLSVNSDFDDEISMFFDDKGEPINYRDRNEAVSIRISATNGDNVSLPDDFAAANPASALPSAIPVGRNAKLRHRIKRKFFNFSFNELIRRRRSKKSTTAAAVAGSHDAVDGGGDGKSSTGGSPSPKPEKRNVNVFPEQDTMKTLTDRDIEREQGKALSKYARNLMIFNWLHNTEETWFHSQMQ